MMAPPAFLAFGKSIRLFEYFAVTTLNRAPARQFAGLTTT
jgi:hypothetical protein